MIARGGRRVLYAGLQNNKFKQINNKFKHMVVQFRCLYILKNNVLGRDERSFKIWYCSIGLSANNSYLKEKWKIFIGTILNIYSTFQIDLYSKWPGGIYSTKDIKQLPGSIGAASKKCRVKKCPKQLRKHFQKHQKEMLGNRWWQEGSITCLLCLL